MVPLQCRYVPAGNTGIVIGTISPKNGTVVVPLQYYGPCTSRKHRHCHRYRFAKKWYSSGPSTVLICASRKHRHCHRYCFAENGTVAVPLQYRYAPAGNTGTVTGIVSQKKWYSGGPSTAPVRTSRKHRHCYRYCSPKSGTVMVSLQCRYMPA